MKILHSSSNPRLPSKNIPLPPRRNPGPVRMQRVGGDEEGLSCSKWGTSWRQMGSGRWEEQSGATYKSTETTDMMQGLTEDRKRMQKQQVDRQSSTARADILVVVG